LLAKNLLAQVDVLAFELRLEAANLLVLAHVLDRERHLVGRCGDWTGIHRIWCGHLELAGDCGYNSRISCGE